MIPFLCCMNHSRYLSPFILEDLTEKMVFLGGPRQCGKTTLALSFLDPASERNEGYLNWDIVKNRKALQNGELPAKERIVLDEIHKYARWRNLVKGFYDEHKQNKQILVTGSARLDYYRKGGDSLHGRYHYFRLHPFSLGELDSTFDVQQQLLKFGGFPEPLFKHNERFHRRWQAERIARVVYEDLRDLEQIKEISLVELLINSLPDRVGSPLSIKSLREDLQVAHYTIERWITALENMYMVFRIPSWRAKKIRAVKKEQKLYFWDWSQVIDTAARFENMVASHLLKYCHFLQDTQGHKMELCFIRDTDLREIDFVVIKDNSPLFAVECKTGEKQISPRIRYFRERTSIPKFYQVHLGTKNFGNDKTGRVLPFHRFCSELTLP